MASRYWFNRWAVAAGAVLLLGVMQTAMAQTAQAPQTLLKYPKFSQVLERAFSAGVHANHLKEPSAPEFTPIGFQCMRQLFFRPEVLNQIIGRSPQVDVAWLEVQLGLPENAAKLKAFDDVMVQAMQQTDEAKMDKLAINGFEQLTDVLSDQGYPVLMNSLNALGNAPDQPEFERYWADAMKTPQCKAYADQMKSK